MKKSAPIAILFLTIFIDLLGFGIIVPILPNFVKVNLGGTSALVGMIAALYAIMNFLFAPFWGTLSDRLGRRPVIAISVALTMLSYVILAITDNFWLLVISRALSGIGSANISAANAYIADITPPEKRAKNMGIIGAAFGLGFIFGPPVGGYLMEHTGMAGVGGVSAALCALNLILVLWLLPESLSLKNPEAPFSMRPVRDLFAAMQQREIRHLFLLNFMFIMAFSMMQITAALLWKEFYDKSDSQIGNTFAFIGLSSALVQGFLVGWLNRVFGERRLLQIGFPLMGIGLITMPLVPVSLYIPLELLAILLIALANGCIMPSVLSLISRSASAAEQGKMLGLNQSFGSLARVFGPVLGGAIYDLSHYSPYVLGMLMMLGCAVFIHFQVNIVRPK